MISCTPVPPDCHVVSISPSIAYCAESAPAVVDAVPLAAMFCPTEIADGVGVIVGVAVMVNVAATVAVPVNVVVTVGVTVAVGVKTEVDVLVGVAVQTATGHNVAVAVAVEVRVGVIVDLGGGNFSNILISRQPTQLGPLTVRMNTLPMASASPTLLESHLTIRVCLSRVREFSSVV